MAGAGAAIACPMLYPCPPSNPPSCSPPSVENPAFQEPIVEAGTDFPGPHPVSVDTAVEFIALVMEEVMEGIEVTG